MQWYSTVIVVDRTLERESDEELDDYVFKSKRARIASILMESPLLKENIKPTKSEKEPITLPADTVQRVPNSQYSGTVLMQGLYFEIFVKCCYKISCE